MYMYYIFFVLSDLHIKYHNFHIDSFVKFKDGIFDFKKIRIRTFYFNLIFIDDGHQGIF